MHKNQVYSGSKTGNNEQLKRLQRHWITSICISFISLTISVVTLALLLKFVILAPKEPETNVTPAITTPLSTTTARITTEASFATASTTKPTERSSTITPSSSAAATTTPPPPPSTITRTIPSTTTTLTTKITTTSTSTETTITQSTTSPPPRPGDGICAAATWARHAQTVAGGRGHGSTLNQLNSPYAIFVDEDQAIYISDSGNDRLLRWEHGASSGYIIAGGKGKGNYTDQLYAQRDFVVDKDGTMYICDDGNQRLQKWSRNALSGQTVIKNFSVDGIAQDDEGFFYTTDVKRGEVRKWRIGDTVGQILISKLNNPVLIFVDRNRSIFVADSRNHRVIKVDNGTTQMSIVAGGSQGNSINQLDKSESVIVDQLGTVYVADTYNHRIMRWPRGATVGSVIAGGRGEGSQSDQFSLPTDLSFDLHGNLYVADFHNHRVQKFAIDKSLC